MGKIIMELLGLTGFDWWMITVIVIKVKVTSRLKLLRYSAMPH
jgi:hypothetical protein